MAKTVLIVDDNTYIRQALCQVFTCEADFVPTVPLIMYSAFGDTFMEQQARLIGVSELVSKSQPAAILLNKARSLLYRTAA
jgi:hypothetical protein